MAVVEVRKMRQGVRCTQVVFACCPHFCCAVELAADDVELVAEPVHGVVQLPVVDDVHVDPPVCIIAVHSLPELAVLSLVAVEESSEPSRHGFCSLGMVHRSCVEFNSVWIGGRVVPHEVSGGTAVMEDMYPPDGLDDPIVHWDCELREVAIVGHIAIGCVKVLPGVGGDMVVEEVAFLLEVREVDGVAPLSCFDGTVEPVDDSVEHGGVQVWVTSQGIASTSG
jgi:hypothetical protein